MTSSKPIPPDPAFGSTNAEQPANLSRTTGTPVYHGFVVVPETCTDGWCMGVISDYEDPDGVDAGDAYVIAPDGTRADLVWGVGVEPILEILPPDEERWGVYAVCFPHVVRDTADLTNAFRALLPSLKETHARVKRHVG